MNTIEIVNPIITIHNERLIIPQLFFFIGTVLKFEGSIVGIETVLTTGNLYFKYHKLEVSRLKYKL